MAEEQPAEGLAEELTVRDARLEDAATAATSSATLRSPRRTKSRP